MTWEFYHEIFGKQLKRENIHPIGELLARQEQEHDAYKALHRFLQAPYRFDRPVQFPAWHVKLPGDTDQTVVQLKQSREQMLTSLADYQKACSRFDEAKEEKQDKIDSELVRPQA